ncbi:hypothetical protein FIBSPDRAFT_812908 [Athelia psychrophila]|uniref:N-acetyltransferase domain-containing protein n=1 Tax=Athelia psychrophila TaxID=1759441 RepID=A0A166UQ14_9AGAM|nr:hypothetical protein FIBSPDRAFT_812908 [Fibularhizoctonia sp. CBS 109695]
MIVDNVVLKGERVILVPYKAEHVMTYHSWMEDEILRDLTASERLSLDEEYEMQKKWRIDDDKLTFIILARPEHRSEDLPGRDDSNLDNLPMVGDVNMFLKGIPPHLRKAPSKNASFDTDEQEEDDFEAELEIMIADPESRRKGLAYEALQLLISYATDPRDVTNTSCPAQLPIPRSSLVVRVSQSNTPSIKLFERLGMRIVKWVEAFQEVEMR